LSVDVHTAAEELRIADGVRQIGMQKILTKPGWRFVRHFDAVLKHRNRKLEQTEQTPPNSGLVMAKYIPIFVRAF